jgi:hypothetical protein
LADPLPREHRLHNGEQLTSVADSLAVCDPVIDAELETDAELVSVEDGLLVCGRKSDWGPGSTDAGARKDER